MMERYCFSCQVLRSRVVWVLSLLLLGAIGRVSVADIQYSIETSGYRSIPLAHISPQLARSMLEPLKLATVSLMPGSNWVLVTGEAEQVRKAAVILELIDAVEPYEIKEVRSASSPKALPSNDEIAAGIGGIAIGTFNRPPRYTNKAKAIIDVHNGSIWAVAPALRMADIAAALEAGPQGPTQQKAASDRITDGAMLDALQTKALLEARFNPPLGERKLNPAFSKEGRPLIAAATPMPNSVSPSLLGQAEVAALAQAAPGAQPDDNTPATPESNAIPVTSEPRTEGAAEPNRNEAGLQPGEVVPAQPATEPNTYADSGAEPSMSASDLVDPERVVNVTLPERLPVIQLLDLVGKYMNLDYIYDPQDVAGEVTLKLNGSFRGAVKVKDLYYLLESILRFKNLAMTRHKGNVVTIVKKEQAMDVDPRLVDANETAGMPGDAVVTRVFKLEYIDTNSAKNLLEGMRVAMDVKPLEETGTIIVTAYAFRMARIEQLLSIVDKPGEPRKFQYRQLKYTMAKTLADKVKNLAEQLQSVSVTVGAPEAETLNLTRLPGESDAVYMARINRLRAAAAISPAARAAAARPEQTKPTVYLDADERTNRILMIGEAKQLEMVNSLVDSLDVEQQDLRSFKLYTMKHVDAQDVAKKLQELGVISKAPESPMSQRITSTAQRTAQQPMTSEEARIRAMQEQARIAAGLPATSTTEPTSQGPVEEPQVVVVEATNSLLVNATPEQHAQIEKIISYVDSEMVPDDTPYKIYPLENSSPDHMATVLTSLIQETTENKDKDGKIVDTTTVRKIQDEITIVPDPNTYSLIVYGNKKNQEWISNLIRQLDKRRPQVLIDVTLVEITNNAEFNYDLNLIESIPDLTATSGLTGTLVPGTSPITSSDIITKLSKSGRSQFADMQSSGGKFNGFYGDKHVNLLLTAMESKNYGRVLAKPKILVNDNENGLIKTADVTYVKKESSIPVATGGAGNSGQLVTTATDYQQYEAGIELNIVPHISEGDLLQLKATLTRSDFLPTSDTDKPPNKTESQVDTNVTVPDGSTIILGGMLKMNQNKGGSKVPLLGDLPLVGGLFRTVNNTDNESKLYVFVKAEIIRPATLAKGMQDLRTISDRNREAFEGHEKEFQDYQSWPGLKPEPVEPARVLDAQ
jgi:general secretion pathway protein D